MILGENFSRRAPSVSYVYGEANWNGSAIDTEAKALEFGFCSQCFFDFPARSTCFGVPLLLILAVATGICKDTLAERLRRRPAKPMGSPRVGSSPTGVVFTHMRVWQGIPRMPPWPNGQGVGLLIRRLHARALHGVSCVSVAYNDCVAKRIPRN